MHASLSSISGDSDAALLVVVTLVAVGHGAQLLRVGQPRPLLSSDAKDSDGGAETSEAVVCISVVRWAECQLTTILKCSNDKCKQNHIPAHLNLYVKYNDFHTV